MSCWLRSVGPTSPCLCGQKAEKRSRHPTLEGCLFRFGRVGSPFATTCHQEGVHGDCPPPQEELSRIHACFEPRSFRASEGPGISSKRLHCTLPSFSRLPMSQTWGVSAPGPPTRFRDPRLVTLVPGREDLRLVTRALGRAAPPAPKLMIASF